MMIVIVFIGLNLFRDLRVVRLHRLGVVGSICNELQCRVALTECLSSSMRDEIERVQLINEELRRQIGIFARSNIDREERCMQNIINLARRANLSNILARGIIALLERGVVCREDSLHHFAYTGVFP
ncbi:hypothetical protein NPIL_509951 [Nephila pilipes]|uniref:Uncharacterized protein n=1 Tax=Nephila pilipes TaxID=299642 RepID=A0A8X6NCV4_NEPPI|nr:hypothetical protein NPIL_509951 [Nephila pilipes]